ncbi:3-deoxy-manno-octulosonate cytidylyltransferase [Hellea sp.]|nr:3-deoxy-manno-octulosonate cytidylyltransferase [Hellea sp.]
MQTLIVVPARYASTRFPGKPLAKINGISMLRRTARTAQLASKSISNAQYVVATDDARIQAHCAEHDIPCVMTPADLKTGSDRALAAAEQMTASTGMAFDFIINLQGDAPFTPVNQIVALAEALKGGAEVATPYIQLSWQALADLREHKAKTPFSGTCVIVNQENEAIWFSKNIIPAIRKEDVVKESMSLSPVRRHVGLYAYTQKALKTFTQSPESAYEKLEGLEQLRLLENGIVISCVSVEPTHITISGIDSPEDLALAEALIAKHGDPYQ